MAPVRRADESLGPILPEIATATGLAADTPVLCGIHDSNASLLPHLIGRATPFSVVSTGTWVISMAIGGVDVELDPARDTLVNVNAFGEPVPSARFMGGREFETLLGEQAAATVDADVEAVLSEQILLTPSVQQGSGPFPGRQAEWVGGEPHGRSTHRRCVVLSGDDDGDRARADRGEGTDDRRRSVRRQRAVLENARGSDRSRRDGRRNERDRNQHRGIAAGERPRCAAACCVGRSDRLARSGVAGLRRLLAPRGWAEFRS